MSKDMRNLDNHNDRASKVEMKHELRLNCFQMKSDRNQTETWQRDGTDAPWIVSHTATTRKRKTSPTPRCANESASRSVSDHVGCFADDDGFPLGCAQGVSCNCLSPFTTNDSDDAAVSLLVVRLSGSINKASTQLRPSGASILPTPTRQAQPYDSTPNKTDQPT